METKTKNNVVTYFMWYIYNKYDESESELLFGNMGEYIFRKLIEHGGRCCALSWYADLDNDCQQRLVDRAIELYDGK